MALVVFFAGLEILARLLIFLIGGLPDPKDDAHPDFAQRLAKQRAPAEPSLPLREFLHPFLGYAPIQPGVTQSVMRLWFPVRQDVPPNAFVVGLMGGSVAYQLYQSGELQAAFARHPTLTRGATLHLVPLCYDGWRQPQSLICLMLAQLENLPLDLVINLDGFNEIEGGLDNWHNQVPIVAPYADMMARLHFLKFDMINEATLDCLVQCRELVRREHMWFATARRPPWRYSACCRLLCLTMARNIRHRIMKLEDRRGRACLRDDKPGFALPQLTSSEKPEQSIVRYWLQAADAGYALCRQANVSYYHFIQPINYGFVARRAGGPDADDRDNSRTRYFHSIYSEMAAKSLKVPYMRDLSHCFAGKDERMFTDDCHMNDQGQARLAAIIAGHVASNAPPVVAVRGQ